MRLGSRLRAVVAEERELKELERRARCEMPEPVFDSWANYVVEVLKTESLLAGSFTSNPTLIGDAREAIVEGVLKRILPPAYEIGRGQIIDSAGGKSRPCWQS